MRLADLLSEQGIANALEQFADQPEWLVALTVSKAVATALERGVRELASGAMVLRACEVGRVRIKKNSRTASYSVSVQGAEAGQIRVVELVGEILLPGGPAPGAEPGAPFGSEGWRCYLPELRLDLRVEPPADVLPALMQLTDPEQARPLLEQAIRSGSSAYPDLRIEACSPEVMRVKQSRCTIVYQLEFASEDRWRGWPTPVVAKTYGGDKGVRAYEGMVALWQSPLGTSSNVRIAEPLAYVPELTLLVQGPVPVERTLKQVTKAAFESGTDDALREVAGYLEQTAVGLAELHTSGAVGGETFTWADKVEDLTEVATRVAALRPSLADATERLLGPLDAAVAGLASDPPVPSHGSFRPNQVVVAGNGIGFIDFDRFSAAEPSLDVSAFITAFRDAAFRAALTRADATPADELARLDELSQLFLDRYSGLAGISRERLAAWQALEIFNTVLDCWIKLESGLQERLQLLAHHLQRAGLG